MIPKGSSHDDSSVFILLMIAPAILANSWSPTTICATGTFWPSCRAYNLRNAKGTDYNLASAKPFSNWQLNAGATSVAYMLSTQLAATELNVRHNFVNGGLWSALQPCLLVEPWLD